MSSIQQLLILCARTHLHPADTGALVRCAAQITDWSAAAARAEAQGLGPLLARHLQMAGVTPSKAARRQLQALAVRHRDAFAVRARALAEILTAFEQAGIPVRVLKGAALAHLIYPAPGLRSMRDLDLLVSPTDARRAQQLLAQLGFAAPLPPPGTPLPDKHLTPATRADAGLTVTVELHTNLFHAFDRASFTLVNASGPPLAFSVNGVAAQTLGPEDMLWHLCRHIAYHASIWEPIRLIWVADLVGFAEEFAAQIDWSQVARRYPPVLNMLSLFHFVTPLPAELRARTPLNIEHSPQGVGQEFDGWPRHRWAELRRHNSVAHILRDTFFPSEWWLRLHYGLNSAQPLFWYRWLRHPLYVLGPLYLAEKARLWWHLRARPRWTGGQR